MRKFFAGMVFMALAGALALAAPPQDRDDRRDRDERHDNGKHKGDKHGDRDDDDRHDNGKHKGWDKHDRDDHRDWDADHDRIRPGRAYPHGRYEHLREVYVARRFDPPPGTSFCTIIPIGSWPLTMRAAAATGSGTAIKFTSTTTTITRAGTCSSTPAWAAPSTSNTSASTKSAATSLPGRKFKGGDETPPFFVFRLAPEER